MKVGVIGAGIDRPVIGMHFFDPAPVMKLVEVIAGLNTPAETVETIKKISEEIGIYADGCFRKWKDWGTGTRDRGWSSQFYNKHIFKIHNCATGGKKHKSHAARSFNCRRHESYNDFEMRYLSVFGIFRASIA